MANSKLAALLAMTVENGCSEAEAENAAALAQKLLDSGAEVAIEQTITAHCHDLDSGSIRIPMYIQACVAMFAKCYDCKALISPQLNGNTLIKWVGLKDDAETACHFCLVFMDIFERKSKTIGYRGKHHGSFVMGAADALVKRLEDLRSNSARGVAIRKDVLIDNFMATRNIRKNYNKPQITASVLEGIKFGATVSIQTGIT